MTQSQPIRSTIFDSLFYNLWLLHIMLDLALWCIIIRLQNKMELQETGLKEVRNVMQQSTKKPKEINLTDTHPTLPLTQLAKCMFFN